VVVAGVSACLALALATVQAYPQATAGPDHRYVLLMVIFDVAAAGYLGLAWRLPAAGRDQRYALAAGLATAVAALFYVARPSLLDLWAGPLPGGPAWAVTFAAPLAATLAAARGNLGEFTLASDEIPHTDRTIGSYSIGSHKCPACS